MLFEDLKIPLLFIGYCFYQELMSTKVILSFCTGVYFGTTYNHELKPIVKYIEFEVKDRMKTFSKKMDEFKTELRNSKRDS